jgi:ParB-like chromosome segregation protein Spo0J
MTPKRADGIPVHCAHSKLVEIGTLKPHPKNPNTHPERQVKLLAKVIKLNGWRRAIVVSDRSGYIVKGHGTLMAAQLAKLKEVPVDVQHYEDDEAEIRDLIADNRIPELSYRENRSVVALLQQLEAKGQDIESAGYANDELQALIATLEANVTDGAQRAGRRTHNEADTMLVLGPYRVKIPRADFASWHEKIRQQVGFKAEDVHAEIRRRLSL